MFKKSLFLAAALILAAIPVHAQTDDDDEIHFVGSDKCKMCHKEIHASYALSGHPFKIRPLDGDAPDFPPGTSSGVPDAPIDQNWVGLSFVIGGYGWKARFMDIEGYILTGPDNRQFNLANETLGLDAHWTGYDDATAPRKPYTCGACHTTGWTATGPDGPHQDDLPGIHGTWAEPGVTCEACHGPGSGHVSNPVRVDMSLEANCAQCHVRGDVTRIDASNGLIKHHEQYEDLLSSPHAALGCQTCHDPHKGTKYGLGGFKGQEATCRTCHADQSEIAVGSAGHTDCTSCHMPFAGKSAVSKMISYKGGTVPMGDIRSHIHRISTDPDWTMFTEDGKFVATDEENRAFLTVEYTCLTCHQSKDKKWAQMVAPMIHGMR